MQFRRINQDFGFKLVKHGLEIRLNGFPALKGLLKEDRNCRILSIELSQFCCLLLCLSFLARLPGREFPSSQQSGKK